LLSRYALQLADTVKITPEKGVCLTEGPKQSKDVLFFLNAEEDVNPKSNGTSSKKPPVAPKGSPLKNKVVGNKVLRGKTRSAAQQEAQNSASLKLIEHQRELHAIRQRDGLAKYAEEGTGGGGKEEKTWKRFQSYKGETGLPPDTESLRLNVLRSFNRSPLTWN
jgi:nucleosome binding factor SPN SPT16 subunit